MESEHLLRKTQWLIDAENIMMSPDGIEYSCDYEIRDYAKALLAEFEYRLSLCASACFEEKESLWDLYFHQLSRLRKHYRNYYYDEILPWRLDINLEKGHFDYDSNLVDIHALRKFLEHLNTFIDDHSDGQSRDRSLENFAHITRSAADLLSILDPAFKDLELIAQDILYLSSGDEPQILRKAEGKYSKSKGPRNVQIRRASAVCYRELKDLGLNANLAAKKVAAALQAVGITTHRTGKPITPRTIKDWASKHPPPDTLRIEYDGPPYPRQSLRRETDRSIRELKQRCLAILDPRSEAPPVLAGTT